MCSAAFDQETVADRLDQTGGRAVGSRSRRDVELRNAVHQLNAVGGAEDSAGHADRSARIDHDALSRVCRSQLVLLGHDGGRDQQFRLGRSQITLLDRGRLFSIRQFVPHDESVDLKSEYGVPGAVVADEFPGQLRRLFLVVSQPVLKFLRVHVGDRDREFREVHGFAVDGFGHRPDGNVRVVRVYLVWGTAVELRVHAPCPACHVAE